MDAGGHKEIGKIGEELLQEALKKSFGKEMRIEAFALGNWLTDLSQIVDARTYDKINKFLRFLTEHLEKYSLDAVDITEKLINEFIEKLDEAREYIKEELEQHPDYRNNKYDLKHFVNLYMPEAVKALLDNPLVKVELEKAKQLIQEEFKKINKGIDELIIGGKDVDASALAEGLMQLVKAYAFFKFVYSAKSKKLSNEKEIDQAAVEAHFKMDMKSFNKIVQIHFSQYFPYEHQDRPELEEDFYDSRKVTTRTPT